MKAVLLTGIKELEIGEVPTPSIVNGDDVLIRMTTVGVCGSDVHYYRDGKIGTQIVDYPFPVGHEGAGVVEEVGKGVTGLKPGDRLAIDPAVSCLACDQCLSGRPHTCRKLKFLGCPGQLPGCLCEYIVMPERSCFKIPDSMSLTEAAISEPLSVGLYAVKQSIPMEGARVGILGSGPIGLSVLLCARAGGAGEIIVTDLIDSRLDTALSQGADRTGNPEREDVVKTAGPGTLDVVFECCGKQEALDQAVEMLRPGGKLMVVGIPTVERVSFAVDSMRHREICLQNVRRQNHCVRAALDLLENGDLDVDFMATHRYGIEASKDAFDLVNNYQDSVIKAMIDI